MIGLTLIKVVPGCEKSVYSALKDMAGIKDIYSLYGEFNFFVIMQADGRGSLDQLLGAVKAVEKVADTGPMLVAVENDGLESTTLGEMALI